MTTWVNMTELWVILTADEATPYILNIGALVVIFVGIVYYVIKAIRGEH